MFLTNILFREFSLLGLKEEIVKWVGIDVNGRGARCHETRPLPSVVFRIQQEVCAHNGHAHGDHSQDAEHQQHEAVDVVDFVCPKRGEDEVPAGSKYEE